jgi:hypothetical protein
VEAAFLSRPGQRGRIGIFSPYLLTVGKIGLVWGKRGMVLIRTEFGEAKESWKCV